MSNQPEKTTKPAVTSTKPAPVAPPAAAKPVAETPHLPKSWDDIRVGSLVIGFESTDTGWWEAIVTSMTGETLTLRWRDCPKHAAVARRRNQVALLLPDK